MQEFPGGALNPEEVSPVFDKFFAKNCIKIQEIGLGESLPPLHPGSTTA